MDGALGGAPVDGPPPANEAMEDPKPVMPGATVLVTGAGGFVGPAVVARLTQAGYSVRTAGRHEVGEIHRGTDWSAQLTGVDAVVHLAGRAHIMKDVAPDPLEAYREVNLYGTAQLVKQAVEAGIQRFLFMSTIKVLGDYGTNLSPYTEPDPMDPYAVSKIEAELALRELKGDMAAVTLRPPLVYGPGVKGNFRRLMALVAAGRPLPLASIDNERSLIHVDNLADAVAFAMTARPDTYHPKDSLDLSTPDLVRLIADGMGKPIRLFPVPVGLLRLAGMLTGRYSEVLRLTSSFTSDGDMGRWTPLLETKDAVRETARWFTESA